MTLSTTLTAAFQCTLERAFKTPILGDATQYLVGYGPVPPVLGFKNDATWGKEGGHRIPVMKGNLFARGGPSGFDEIVTRKENEYWQWQVTKFDRLGMFFATKAEGEWWVEPQAEGQVTVKWTYTLHPRNQLTRPFTWLFLKLVWTPLMKKGMAGMKAFAESSQEFLYEGVA